MSFRDAVAHRARADLRDGWDRLRGRRDALVPPRRLQTGDYSEFGRLGHEFRELFIHLGGLQPHYTVLDIGCGPGRMAVPLAGWLSGRYEGFDVVGDEVAWCRASITPRFPNFRFQRPDVQNARYNPHGSIPADGFRFPYPDETFDFAFATSVFTHMLPSDVARYLSELGRVLRPGGRALLTWFVLNEQCEAILPTDQFSFGHAVGVARANDPSSLEAAVAYPQDWIRATLEASSLTLEKVKPGGWCGTPSPPTWQDVTIVRR